MSTLDPAVYISLPLLPPILFVLAGGFFNLICNASTFNHDLTRSYLSVMNYWQPRKDSLVHWARWTFYCGHFISHVGTTLTPHTHTPHTGHAHTLPSHTCTHPCIPPTIHVSEMRTSEQLSQVLHQTLSHLLIILSNYSFCSWSISLSFIKQDPISVLAHWHSAFFWPQYWVWG